MELIILGSGCGIPSATKGAAGHVVIMDNEPLLLDSGSGTLTRLMQVGIDYKQLNNVFYTHTHSDHTADLIPLIQALRTTPHYRRRRRLNIYGPEGFTDFLQLLAQAYGAWLLDSDFPLQIHELTHSRLKFSGWSISSIPVHHGRSAIGFRIQSSEGRSIVYSGDTDFCSEIIELANAADVLMLECSFPDTEKIAGHLTPSEAATIAAQAKCGQLILTHIYPPYDTQETEILHICRKIYHGKTIIAHDLMRITI